MQAIVITRNGGPEVLELRDEPDPEPGAGQLLVQLEAAGVNYRDVYEREGRGRAYANTPPLVAGAEGAGTVLRGDGEFSEGDRVAWGAPAGSHPEPGGLDPAHAGPAPGGTTGR